MKKIDKQKEIISLYLSGSSASKIANKFSINVKSIYNILKYNKIYYRHGARKHFPNEEVFGQFNKFSCYWAGFIAADGNVTKNNISIGLQKKDRDHLQKFLDFINADYSICNKKDGTVLISVGSKKMVEDLNKNFGIHEKKTFTIKLPDIPKNMMSHYIRGFFDGDGSIYLGKNSICFDITSGSKPQIEGIKKFIEREGIKCYIYNYINKYSLRRSGKESVKIFNILYKDSSPEILLNRKKERFDNYISIINNNYKNRKFKCIFTERNKKIYELKSGGFSINIIAKQFAMSKSNCYAIIKNINNFLRRNNEII